MDNEENKLKQLLRNNESEVPQAPPNEFAKIQQKISSTTSWYNFTFSKWASGFALAGLMIAALVFLPNNMTNPSSTTDAEIAELLLDSYSYLDDLDDTSEYF